MLLMITSEQKSACMCPYIPWQSIDFGTHCLQQTKDMKSEQPHCYGLDNFHLTNKSFSIEMQPVLVQSQLVFPHGTLQRGEGLRSFYCVPMWES